MNSNRSVGIWAALITIVAIIVIVASLALNANRPPVIPTPTVTNTSLPTATPDPCAPGNIDATLADFDKLSRKFTDINFLAQNTGAAQLAPMITEMQTVRREAEDYAVPVCLNKLKEFQLGFMYTFLDAYMVLYKNFANVPMDALADPNYEPVIALVNQRLAEASEYQNKYQIEGARLQGNTLPAPEATSTPAVIVTVTPTGTP